MFFLVMNSEFVTVFLQTNNKVIYGVDKFLRHLKRKKTILEVFLKVLTNYKQLI